MINQLREQIRKKLMSKNISPRQPLMLSKNCQALANKSDTAWILAFIQQHHTRSNETRYKDMWLFKSHDELQAIRAICIWCTALAIPKEDEDEVKVRHWVLVGEEKLKEEVLIFVKNSTCYTLVEYLEQEFDEPLEHRVPDIIFPGK